MASDEDSWEEDGSGGTEDAYNQHSDENVLNNAQGSHVSGDAADSDSDDGGDYDPESVSFDTAPQATGKATKPSTSQSSNSKPKMSGGFVVEASEDEDEDDDDEEEEDDDTGSNRAATNKPNSQAQSKPTSVVRQPSEVKNGTITAESMGSATQPFPSISQVALLEARIKEDPRGDMDAWLSLLADYKGKNQIDNLRDIYKRFLDVFPQAVCSLLGCG